MTRYAAERREELVALYHEAAKCTRCPLARGRNTVVFGAGNADADLMFVGEGPGAEEDRRGLPFVGRAGQLLNELLAGIGLRREDVFIANTVKCRPPGNRDPQPEEIEACRPYLERQIELIEPRVIATLGNFATKLLTRNQTGISKVRGTPQVHELGGRTVFVMPLFHPAAGLRTPAIADQLRADFERLGALLDEELPRAAGLAEGDASGAVTSPAPESASAAGLSTPDRAAASSSAAATAPSADQLGLFG